MINICQFGAGRIGAIHAGNIARHPDARLQMIVDVDRAAAESLAGRYGAAIGDQAAALADSAVDAVVIASSTDTHADLIEAAARAGKAVFCEKPLDLDRSRAGACLAVAQECGVPLMVGFNRRFDPNFARFMMIHDFDMARWLSGEEPVEVFAAAGVLIDPAIGEAGDVDTAVVTLRLRSGALCQISNSRRAVYGYDQRIEALGSKGALRAENVVESTVSLAGADGIVSEKPLHFFLERYAEAYRRELDHFIDAIGNGTAPLVGGADGVRALALADAALQSLQTGCAIAI